MNRESSFVEVNGVRLHYLSLETERSQPIVFIHGFTDNAACHQPLVNAVADLAAPVAYDVRGHGLSDAVCGYSPETLATDCSRLCQSLFDQPPVLYGHSLGAEIAARAAADIQVAGLVLEDPPAALVNRQDFDRRTEEVLADLRNWRTRPHDAIEREYNKSDPRFANALATARKQLRPEVVRICRWKYTPLEALVRNIDIQTLVLRPDPAVVEYLDERTGLEEPHVRVEYIDGAGHTVARDEYHAVVTHLREFLKSVRHS